DILVYNEKVDKYDLYEVKSSTASEDKGGRKTKDYIIDIAFQLNVIDIPINKSYLIRLNKEYIRLGSVNLDKLFLIEDLTEQVNKVLEDVKGEMEASHYYLSQEQEPKGNCDCIIKGLNGHCATSPYSNDNLPEYPVHAISRIHKNKLIDLVDNNILSIYDIPEDFKLSENQRRQVDTAQTNREKINREGLAEFLNTINYPISFIDYETFPSAIPKFDNYKPYQQIPFQFSLHIKESPNSEIEHYEHLHIDNSSPDEGFYSKLRELLPSSGSIVVWNKKFECGINKQLVERLPACSDLMNDFENRVVDLMVPFYGKTNVYDHPGFRGSASIKAVLPVLVSELSYKELNIQEGGTASDSWNRMILGEYDIEKTSVDLREYCKLDTLAMVKIWEVLIQK
ncbi:MAG: DUF2779 domain-containing protein, partial [Patescibacteria group bacterium]|nr:DUF2779 domain-containing protein [Patescibacteria group bacterium]